MNSSIAAIHIAKKQLSLDDDTYRAKLMNITGKRSTKDMSEDERQRVITVLRNDGFKPVQSARRPDGRLRLSGKYARKLQALWIAGWNLGIVRNREDAALQTFVTGQTGLTAERFLHHAEDARKVIEALKKWMEREGSVDWSDDVKMAGYLRSDGYRIARAQWAILSPKSRNDFWPVVTELVDQTTLFRDFTDQQWITVMNHFGNQIRKLKAVQA
ncbi:Mu-like prophage protein Gp16 [Neorhizobium galegae bv. orientalis]|nr:Mu-like prophage protein Gp16 [Neorhizobium galegae bv. orientalis]